MKNHIIKFSTLILLLLSFMTSCQKEILQPEDNMTMSAPKEASEISPLVDAVMDDAIYRASPATPVLGCPSIRRSAPWGTYPNSVVYDFSSAGCRARDGHYYSGQIKVHFTASYLDKGSVITVRTGNLTIDGVPTEFMREVTNMGFDKNNQMYWHDVENGTRRWADDGSANASWSSDRIRIIMKGYDTADDPADDSFAITGFSKGITRENFAYQSVVTEPLIKRNYCYWIESGVITYTLVGRDGSWKLDYGDGACDDKATVTFPNGSIEAIVLRKPFF